MTYFDLIEEYKALRNKLPQLSGTEHEAAMMRLIEIDNTLRNFERNMERNTSGSTNYNSFMPARATNTYSRKEVIVWTGIGICFGIMIAALITILCK